MSQLILPGNTGPGDVRAGKLFCAGLYYNAQGTLVDRTGTAVVLTPGAADIAIPAGIYGGLMADGKVAAVAVTAAHLLAGDTVAGTAGTMSNLGATGLTPATTTVAIPEGYRNGSGVVAAVTAAIDGNIIAANILAGKTILGVTGTALRVASGSFSSTNPLTVTGLSFRPKYIIAWGGGNDSVFYNADVATAQYMQTTIGQETIYNTDPTNSSGFVVGFAGYISGHWMAAG